MPNLRPASLDALPPGEYGLRHMADDHYVTLAAAPFTVTAD
jgi:hypothetical protein